MNKWLLLIGIVFLALAIPIGYYLISPLFIEIEVQEESPFERTQTVDTDITDNFDSMSESEKAEMEKQVDEANRNIVVVDDDMPEKNTGSEDDTAAVSGPQLLSEGMFKPRAHHVAGNALMIQDGDSRILRFEDFETDNGPNLHIWLASTLGEEDYVDLGPIKATKGNVNYDVPSDVNLDRYDKVLVWCVPFGVLFSYAELS